MQHGIITLAFKIQRGKKKHPVFPLCPSFDSKQSRLWVKSDAYFHCVVSVIDSTSKSVCRLSSFKLQ